MSTIISSNPEVTVEDINAAIRGSSNRHGKFLINLFLRKYAIYGDDGQIKRFRISIDCIRLTGDVNSRNIRDDDGILYSFNLCFYYILIIDIYQLQKG